MRKLIMIVVMLLVLLSGLLGRTVRVTSMPMMHHGTPNSHIQAYICPPPPVLC